MNNEYSEMTDIRCKAAKQIICLDLERLNRNRLNLWTSSKSWNSLMMIEHTGFYYKFCNATPSICITIMAFYEVRDGGKGWVMEICSTSSLFLSNQIMRGVREYYTHLIVTRFWLWGGNVSMGFFKSQMPKILSNHESKNFWHEWFGKPHTHISDLTVFTL